MKRKFWISAVGVSIIATSIVAYLLIANHVSTELLVDLGFAEQITVLYGDATITITDCTLIQDVVVLIQDGVTPWPRGLDGQIGCPFDITLVFEGSGREVRVSPATDDCDAISIDGRMSKIDLWNKSMLFQVIEMYTLSGVHEYAERLLCELRESHSGRPEALGLMGLTVEEMAGMRLGYPFSIYHFDKQGQLIGDGGITVFPLIYY